MIDHIGLPVSDVAKSKSFFAVALAPLGYKPLMDFGEAVGFGQDRPDFWIGKNPETATNHVAFAAPSRAAVKAFYDAAIAAGGKTTARRDCARNIIRIITALSCSIATATTSRRFAINPNDPR